MKKIIQDLLDEGNSAKAHFETWWALRNRALPDFYSAMNKHEYVNFFHVSNTGHYKLFFISLAKIFDPDTRTSGMRRLKDELKAIDRQDLVDFIESNLAAETPLIEKITKIRSQSIAHNQADLSREKVYEISKVTPDEIRGLIEKTCKEINYVAHTFGFNNLIIDDNIYEQATIKMLEQLNRAKT